MPKASLSKFLPETFRIRAYGVKMYLKRVWDFSRSHSAGGPNFLVAGGVKCGTYSLWKYLEQHPSVVVSYGKEPGYFNRPTQSYPDHKWYEKQFRVFDNRQSTDILAIGEFTPSYSFSPCIERIHEYNPNMKIILMVRNPVRRAISQYHMYVDKEQERRPIRQALFDDDGEPHISYAYLTRGRYHEQLVLLYDHFRAEQILVQRVEDLSSEPEEVMQNITNFLGISPLSNSKYVKYNAGSYLKDIDPPLLLELQNYFAPYNAKLHNDFGIRVDDWE